MLALSSAELQIARTLSGSEAVSAGEALARGPVSEVMLALLLLGTFTGLVVLVVALWRAGVVPGWVVAAVAVAVVGDMVASTVTAVVVAVWTLLMIAFARVARARAGTAEAAAPPPREPALR